MSNLEIIIQNCCDAEIPSKQDLSLWANTTLAYLKLDSHYNKELIIRVVDNAESQQLNRDYRGKDKPTNVLSFPYEPIPGEEENTLGDLVICADIVKQREEWAHLVIHGVLHLLGYDHIKDDEAEQMEAIEIAVMSKLNFSNPYQD